VLKSFARLDKQLSACLFLPHLQHFLELANLFAKLLTNLLCFKFVHFESQASHQFLISILCFLDFLIDQFLNFEFNIKQMIRQHFVALSLLFLI
jgi:hypothetical protein